MKKDTIFKIYDLIGDTQMITNNLKEFLILDNHAGEILYELLDANKYIIDDENLKTFIEMTWSINTIDNVEYQRPLIENIKNMLQNDYICNDSNFKEVLGSINYLLNYEYWEDFNISENDDLYFYKTFMVENLLKILDSLSNVELDELYLHNTSFILDIYTKVLHDIKSTTSNNMDLSENDIRIRRVSYITNILSNKDVINLNNKKFNSVLKISSTISNIEKLKKFENIILFNKLKQNCDFDRLLDEYADELNPITIDRINKKLGVEKKFDEDSESVLYYRKIYDDEREKNIVKKILKPEKKS